MSGQLLPPHLMELQLAQIDLLQAMYPDEGIITMDDSSSETLDRLRLISNGPGSRMPSIDPASSVSLLLTVEADEERSFQLEIAFPFGYTTDALDEAASDEPPPPRIRLVQPSWMNKAEASSITTNYAQEDQQDDLFTRIEQIKEAVASHLSSQSVSSTPASFPHDSGNNRNSLVRVWFWFPSISTRAKRDDIVNYAPSYGLTGFLLSGKPGVLCLEGASERVDAYMKFIKTESWGDIPAHHKKVTERLREIIDVGKGQKRIFKDMQEITDTLGERRGERANRNDMKLLEAWLVERGLGEALMKVLS
ncbi:Protein of unknown function (DUF1115) domain containing protein [Naviculisporaceae sp. PSN 640]